MKKGFVLCVITFLLAGCGGNVQQSPESTIEAFLSNVSKLNETSPTTIDQAQKVLKSLFSSEKAYEAFTTTFRNIEIDEFSIGAVSSDNMSARVPVTMKSKGLIGMGKEEAKEVTFSLEKKSGNWYIKDIAGVLEKYEKKPEIPENEIIK